MRHASSRRPSSWTLILLVGLGLVGLLLGVMTLGGSKEPDPLVELQPRTTPQVVVSPPTLMPSRPSGCDAWSNPHKPVRIGIDGIGFRDVESLPRSRDTAGNISSPDPTNYNPSVFAWDNESSRPGQSKGRVLLTAHTYHADNSALGNRLIAELQTDDFIRVDVGRRTLCYRVTERLQVETQDYPVGRIYESDSEGIAITVCSGYDGREWQQRTIWFAEPVK